MINKIKRIIKNMIKWDYLMDTKEYDPNNFSISLRKLVDDNPEILLDGRSVGKRINNKPFSSSINVDAYNFFSYKVHKYGDSNIKELSEYDNFQSGTPMKAKPFPLAIREVRKTLRKNNLYMYPSNTGNARSKKRFLEYLIKEGFVLEKKDNYDGLSIDNIAFTCSTSQAYMMIVKLLAREEDVILLTGPNYGLFAIESERYNAHVEILDLKEEDDWFVNPDNLAQKIDDINKKLEDKFKDKLNYVPRVVAFLNMNPHNPLGKVMSNKNKDLLFKIGDICLEKGVFVIDDLIYRDLTFDQDNLALPLATNPKYFNNTISLFGISKAYGLASFRAGVMVAPIPICNAINDQMYQNMVSMPVLQVQSTVGAFNGSKKRYKIARRYFKKVIDEYKYRYLLFLALIEGIDVIKENKIKNRIIKDIKKHVKNGVTLKMLLEGIPNVEVRRKTTPDSGFFAVLDFTKIRGKKYDGNSINDDYDLLKYLYSKGRIEYIMGKSMNWPNDEIIARVNFALEKDALIHNIIIINKAIRELR